MKREKQINYLTSIFLVFFFFIIPTAEAKFEFTPTCQKAMQDILDLRFRDAKVKIEEERKVNPDNGYIIYLEHYSEAIELIITEDPLLYEDIIDHYEERMERMDELDDGTPDNAWLQSEMLFQTGLAQVKFGTRINGATKILSSYKRIQQHRQKYPMFWQNQKLAGIYNILFDYIPPFMRWATEMFGFYGDADMGIFQMTQYCEKAAGIPGLAEEAVLFTNLCYKLMQQEAEGFDFLKGQDKHVLEIATVKYLYANSAIYCYQNDLALQLLSEIQAREIQVDFYGMDYVIGRSKLNRLDRDAGRHLEKYLSEYPGLDYKKDACNRLSYYYLLRGDMAKYMEFKAKVADVGQDLRDRDQEALLESSSLITPDTSLLKARLLCDGGYFDQALAILNAIDPHSLSESYYRLEYHYRLGRILELKGQKKEAVPELQKAYNEGKAMPYTFATRAALYLGKIYEESGDYRSAAMWYDRCIDVYSSSHTTEGVKDSAERGMKRAKAKV